MRFLKVIDSLDLRSKILCSATFFEMWFGYIPEDPSNSLYSVPSLNILSTVVKTFVWFNRYRWGRCEVCMGPEINGLRSGIPG